MHLSILVRGIKRKHVAHHNFIVVPSAQPAAASIMLHGTFEMYRFVMLVRVKKRNQRLM